MTLIIDHDDKYSLLELVRTAERNGARVHISYDNADAVIAKLVAGGARHSAVLMQIHDEFVVATDLVEPLHQVCVGCRKTFDFPEMTSVAKCPHCGERQTPR